MSSHIEVAGVRVPSLMYGTAWKEDATESLVREALVSGFRAFDTANQRKHYFEAGVGAALTQGIAEGLVVRSDLFLQTKFTQVSGQDARLPYDKGASDEDQVEQSFQSSLQHLGVSYLDSYVLHGPARGKGLVAQDWRIWSAMETLHRSGKARLLGISNVSLEQLEKLYSKVTIKPAFVQNRCYASQGWDRDVRTFCLRHGIGYQGFSLLTANPKVLAHRVVNEIALRAQASPAEIVFRFALAVQMIVLTGTRSREHMRLDLGARELELTPDEVRAIESLEG